MPKIPRVTAKIFASEAAQGDIGQFGSALTGTKVLTSDISQIQALDAYLVGWRKAVISNRKYPTLQEMNGLLKTISQQLAYTLQIGIPEYDPETDYQTDSVCQKNGVWYQSLTSENIGNDPETSNTNWQKLTFTTYWGTIEGNISNQTDLKNALEGKMDVNASNISSQGKTTLTNLSFPSTKTTTLSLAASGSTYTAPADGEVSCFIRNGAAAYQYVDILRNGVRVAHANESTSSAGQALGGNFSVSKGDEFKVTYNATGGVETFKFIYAQGVS